MPFLELKIYRRHLPHWRVEGATYFVTWRLHRLQADLEPHERETIAEALRHFDHHRYALLAYVVMNDHIHVLVTPRGDWSLASITHTWKSFTAWKLHREKGRRGRVWQNESYDRIVRGPAALRAMLKYIAENPRKRWPRAPHYPWLWIRGSESAER